MRVEVVGPEVDDLAVQFLLDSLQSKFGGDRVAILQSASEASAALSGGVPVAIIVDATTDGGGGASPPPSASADGDEAQVATLKSELANAKGQLSEAHTELAQMELNLSEQFESMKMFQQQQQQLFEQFVKLRKKYDDLKRSTLKLLWEHLPSAHDHKANHIPVCSANHKETMERVGTYRIGKKLGEGEFARVHDCTIQADEENGTRRELAKTDAEDLVLDTGLAPSAHVHVQLTPRKNTPYATPGGRAEPQPPPPPRHALAIKMIVKERIVALHTLARINNEIHAMAMLRPVRRGILALHDVLHTDKYLYLVMEKGGRDLFEFLNAHPNGTTEPIAAQIISRVALAVHRCHCVGVAHRDLKPENILVKRGRPSTTAPMLAEAATHARAEAKDQVSTVQSPSQPQPHPAGGEEPPRPSIEGEPLSVVDVKLCDFGLCAVISEDEGGEFLQDFCGSPGFFAPELVMLKKYGARAADVWSLGCVLLEILLGHERFYELWVSAYDYSLMRDPPRFEERIRQALAEAFEALASTRDRASTSGSSTPTKAPAAPAAPLPPVSEPVVGVVRSMLQFDPQERITTGELLAGDWVRSGCPPEYLHDLGAPPSPTSLASPNPSALVPLSPDYEEASDTPGSLPSSPSSRTGRTNRAQRHAISRDRSFFGRDSTQVDSFGTDEAMSPPILRSPSLYTSKRSWANKRNRRLNLDLGATTNGEETILPPITASTPIIGRARKIVQQGAQLVDRWRPNTMRDSLMNRSDSEEGDGSEGGALSPSPPNRTPNGNGRRRNRLGSN